LGISEIEEVKSIPFTPISHPYTERLIGTVRRECLDQTLFWNEVDLQNKLDDFTDYYNNHRVHASLNGTLPAKCGEEKQSPLAALTNYGWNSLCRGFINSRFQLNYQFAMHREIWLEFSEQSCLMSANDPKRTFDVVVPNCN